MADARRQFELWRWEVEDTLKDLSSKWMVVAKLALMCLGVFMVLWGTFFPETKPDRITLWVLGCFSFFLGVAFFAWHAYLRRRLAKALAEMQHALDFEANGGELRFSPCPLPPLPSGRAHRWLGLAFML
ncbi:hypothetical protein ACP70R_005931 [Stipagrostis hirtigluma subsp. patula]